jgi:hypothetical protein
MPGLASIVFDDVAIVLVGFAAVIVDDRGFDEFGVLDACAEGVVASATVTAAARLKDRRVFFTRFPLHWLIAGLIVVCLLVFAR